MAYNHELAVHASFSERDIGIFLAPISRDFLELFDIHWSQTSKLMRAISDFALQLLRD